MMEKVYDNNKSSVDQELAKSHIDTLKKMYPEIPDTIIESYNPDLKFKIDEHGDIIAGDQAYSNTERVKEGIRIGTAIRENLPAVPESHVRLWRGNRKGEVGLNPSYTNSLEGIALPFIEAYRGPLSYIDIPVHDLKKYEQTGAVARGSEFRLPTDLVSQVNIVGLSEEDAQKLKEKSQPEPESHRNSGWTTIIQ